MTREEEIKNRVRQNFFQDYDATPIIGNIDFAVTTKKSDEQDLFNREYFLWAEAKAGTKEDIYASFVQLIITIGKAHEHEKQLPPRFLGAFDEEKIAFIEFHNIVNVFYKNDFNWNVVPSNHNTKEFKELYDLLSDKLKSEISLFYFNKDEKDLRKFIRSNFKLGTDKPNRVNITKNNFMFVFQRWVEEVKPTINVNWDDVPTTSVVDFFYADLISRNDYTMREELAVVLRGDKYKILQEILKSGTQLFSEAGFTDKQAAYHQFWNKYARPPRKEYLDLILKRRDLLIPHDLRQYQGAFFTPPQWVQKSQEYLALELGEDWQQEYYVWDCCAGTGNLLYGLNEPYRIWASTLNDGDVQVMKERIKDRSLNLLERHVFQFDFLNDDFDKLPQGLQEIINDPEKRKKLVIYINPPYAEAGNRQVIAGSANKQKTDIAVKHKMYRLYAQKSRHNQNGSIGIAGRELFALFFMRIYHEIPTSVLAEFSTLKILQAPNFRDFRLIFRAKLGRNFAVPANSFDNVKGKFPIAFMIWHTAEHEFFEHTDMDFFDKDGFFFKKKGIYSLDGCLSINDWMISTRNIKDEKRIGYMSCRSHDVSNINYNFIMNDKSQMKSPRGSWVTDKNITEACIYIAVCHCINVDWTNDRDQFLFPNENWKADKIFQSDCITYTLFSNFNNIQSSKGTNYWIPFNEQEVESQDAIESHFMHDYITTFTSSSEAQAVMDAGRELWRYYHKQPNANPNASYYDIRLHFQGTKITKSGKVQMNNESSDETYTTLLAALRQRMKVLAKKIEPKVYEYGFLKK